MKNKAKAQLCKKFLGETNPETYGEKFQDHYMEMYKLYLESLDYTSTLKNKTSSYFLTIHTLLISILGLSVSKYNLIDSDLFYAFTPVLGILLALIWWISEHAYNQVIGAKFSIIHFMENKLPAKVYGTEWKILESEKLNLRSKPFVLFIEPLVPLVFVIFYVSFLFFI